MSIRARVTKTLYNTNVSAVCVYDELGYNIKIDHAWGSKDPDAIGSCVSAITKHIESKVKSLRDLVK